MRLTRCNEVVRKLPCAAQCDAAAAILHRTGSPAPRAMLGVCATRNEEAEPVPPLPATWLPTGLLAQIHLKDRHRRAPGQGTDRFASILAMLRRRRRARLRGIEPFAYRPEGPGCAAYSAGYLRSILQAMEDAP